MISGVYGIFDCDTDTCLYVGQSKDIPGRIKSHRYKLGRNEHPRKDLQEWVNSNSLSKVCFKILEVCENDQNIKNSLEIKWFDLMQPLFWGVRPHLNFSSLRDGKPMLELSCNFCKGYFTKSRFQKFCSKSCAEKGKHYDSIVCYPTREDLERLYFEDFLNLSEIAEIYGCDQSTMSGYFKTFGLEAKRQRLCETCESEVVARGRKYCGSCKSKLVYERPTKIVWPELEELLELLEEKSYVDVAKFLGVCDNSIRKHLIRRGIDTKTLKPYPR